VPDTDPRGIYAAYRDERHGFWRDIDGYSDSPDAAGKERGMRYQRAIIAALSRTFVDFYKA
jgi:hypothetical protein